MKALVLAAGEGQRLHPLTSTRPKSLVPIVNKPIIQHIVEAIKAAGIDDIVVVSSPDGEVRDFLGRGTNFGVKVTHITQEKATGTGAAVLLAEGEFKEDFLAVNGDQVVSADLLKNLIKKHSTDATLTLMEEEDLSELGCVVVNGEKVEKIIEKPTGTPPSNLANASYYIFSLKIFEALTKIKPSKRGEIELSDAIQGLINAGSEVKHLLTEDIAHISYPWDILNANKKLLDLIIKPETKGKVESNVVIEGNVFIDEGTIVRAGTYIQGPAFIGKNCDIGPNSYIRPYSVIGDNCGVGQAAEIKNSTLFGSVNVPHLNYVGDSIIGKSVNLGAGTILANLRHDNENVLVKVKGETVDSKRRKLGAIIGDGVKFGSNVTVNPGKKIGAGASVWPGVVVTRDVKEGETYKGE